eukprot:3016320-Prymnesium_polylepis.1
MATSSTPKREASKGKEEHEPFLPPPHVSAAGLSYLPNLCDLIHSDALLSLLRSARPPCDHIRDALLSLLRSARPPCDHIRVALLSLLRCARPPCDHIRRRVPARQCVAAPPAGRRPQRHGHAAGPHHPAARPRRA